MLFADLFKYVKISFSFLQKYIKQKDHYNTWIVIFMLTTKISVLEYTIADYEI
jgi:hypothetical protein